MLLKSIMHNYEHILYLQTLYIPYYVDLVFACITNKIYEMALHLEIEILECIKLQK